MLAADDCTRVYTMGGSTCHLLDPLLSPNQPNSAFCGRSPSWPTLWFGTGTQEEHEKAMDMKTCTACMAALRRRNEP